MYPKRKRRSRLKRWLGRLPIFLVGVLLATAVIAFSAEIGSMDSRQAGNVGLQVVGFLGLISFSSISVGSLMQFAQRTAVRSAGFAGMGIGLFLTLFMGLFATSM